MTHNDIYTKFMIEYDKANVTSSYPSLTKYEAATILDKAYLALIGQKFIGNNVRRSIFESDYKSTSDLQQLVVHVHQKISNAHTPAINVTRAALPRDFMYFVDAQFDSVRPNPADGIINRLTPIKLVTHDIALKFFATSYNIPWIKIPVAFILNNAIYVAYDPINKPCVTSSDIIHLTYIKRPVRFVDTIGGGSGGSLPTPDTDTYLKEIDVYSPQNAYDFYNLDNEEYVLFRELYSGDNSEQNVRVQEVYYPDLMYAPSEGSYSDSPSSTEEQDLQDATFELSDSMAEELISLAVAFALENVESTRLNSKLNMRGLEA